MNESLKPLRIFIVENHSDTLKWLKLYLEGFHHTIFAVRNMTEALQQFPHSNCYVLISDIGLPDGTGWELLAKLQEKQKVFGIAMSGFGTNADNERSRSAGFRHHILKPFKPEELNQFLAEASRELEAA